MSEKIFNSRWIIGGVFVLLCTIFEIHGSSISIYADILQHPELSDIIFGKYRPARSDEYVVFTPFAFSQYFTNFSLISDIVRGTATNMFMTYGQAVWHPAVIFRPAEIGFLFFDPGSGLAFFWMSRLTILFLVSFEFARIILSVEKKLCIIYAIMIAFSPLAQWWWAVNSIAEILAAGQGVAVLWKLYLEQGETRKRFLYAAGFLYCAEVYIFGIYPAWQVPFGYVFLFCLIAVSFQQKNSLKSLWRDKIFWLVGFAVMLAPIIYAVYISRDMIEAQMATEYPGKRFTVGGGCTLQLLSAYLAAYGADVILPFKDIWESTNNCELASFFSMTPLGFLIFFYLRFKLKQKDLLMTLLFTLIILFMIWEVVTLPLWLSKISFMSMTIDNRVRSAIDFMQLVLVFRGLSLIKNFPDKLFRIILAGVIAILPIIGIYFLFPDWIDVQKGLSVFICVSLSVFLFLSPINKKSCAVLAVLMLGIGATVNPISSGVDSVYKMPVGQKISEIVRQEISVGQKKSLWMVENDSVILNDFPIMFGAPTINSVNVYPVLERWEQFNPDRKDFSVYNRHAHIKIALQSDSSASFSFIRLDAFALNLNPEDLPKLEVKYIFSRNGELEKFSTPQVKIQKIYEDAGSFIYKVK